ncbi:hypothetical protein OAR19_00675 [bacterium]|nr:hypothetical protein [bacterium]
MEYGNADDFSVGSPVKYNIKPEKKLTIIHKKDDQEKKINDSFVLKQKHLEEQEYFRKLVGDNNFTVSV